jgi:hypothetical protein
MGQHASGLASRLFLGWKGNNVPVTQADLGFVLPPQCNNHLAAVSGG